MNPLPHQDFELIVKEPLTEVRERITAEVGPKNFWGALSRKKEPIFNGTVDEKSFTVFKNVHTRNTFVPVLYGILEFHNLGTRVYVKMRLQPVISSVFSAALAAVAIFVLFPPGQLSSEARKIIMIVTGIAIVVTYVCFYFEAANSKAAFVNIFGKERANTPLEPSR
jgi:hypothetical protein